MYKRILYASKTVLAVAGLAVMLLGAFRFIYTPLGLLLIGAGAMLVSIALDLGREV